MKLKIGDIFLIIAVLAVAAIMLFSVRSGGTRAVLICDGRETASFDLSENTEYTYQGRYTCNIAVSDGSISVTYADCPDKTCVKTGKISKSGSVICCLPNKMIIRIVGSSETDVISG